MKWKTESPPLSDELIEGFEKITGFKLPRDYRETVQRYPNGEPAKSSLTVQTGPDSFIADFGVLMTLDPFYEFENVLNVLIDLRRHQKLPANLLPFSVDGGGDYFCFSYSSAQAEPSVVYYFHELPPSEGVYPVAESFSKLLALLSPDPDDEEDEEDEDDDEEEE